MHRHLKSHLYDIASAVDEVYSFFENIPMRFDAYQSNLMLKRAVERNIGIIGEAVNRMTREFPDTEITNARAIIATRNRVIHDYAAVTDDVMWKIVVNDLPRLKEEVNALLSAGENP